MNLVSAILAWLTDPAHWSGSGGIPVRLAEHLYFSGLALLVALVIALPIGVVVGHTGRGGFLIVGLANGLRSLPELGLLTLLVLAMGIGLLPVTIALAVLGVPPLLEGGSGRVLYETVALMVGAVLLQGLSRMFFLRNSGTVGQKVLLELRRTGRTSRLRRMVYSELRTSSEAISRTRMAGSWAARSVTLSRRP